MAHEVENMFSVAETPWHGLGVILNKPPTSREAIVAAGLDWQVACEPLFTAGGEKVDRRAVRRTSDNSLLGDVGGDFTPLQNAEAFEFFDAAVASGLASYETAGSLRAGRRVWILARMARDPLTIVKGDDIMPYCLLANGHDGSLSCTIQATPTRVVCSNTLAAALSGRGASVKIRHAANIAANVKAMGAAMARMGQQFEESATRYRALAAHQCSGAQLASYVRSVFAVVESDATAERLTQERAAKRAAELRAERGVIALGPIGGFAEQAEEKPSRVLPHVERLFVGGRGNALPEVRGTWWAAYNAVTEFLQYERRGTPATRLDSLAWGDGAAKSRSALDTALRLAMAA